MSTVSVTDARTHLNLVSADNTGELQAMLDAAEAAIEQRVGPLGLVEHTQVLYGSGSSIVLGVTPVVSITSLTPEGGTAADLSTLDVDLLAGTIARRSGGWGTGRYTVVYQAGRAELPKDLRMAVLELVRHFWETQRGPTRRPGAAASDAASNTIPGAAYIFPFRVEQLLVAHTQLGFGFA